MKQRVAVLLAIAAGLVAAADQGRWPVDRAAQWYAKAGAIRGFNYLPRTAVNSTEMWQAETFDPATIEQELGWARQAGYNSARVFLQYIVWKKEPKAFKDRFRRFLEISERNGISVMPILFDDCAFAGREPYLGPQDPPVPGLHNGGWVPSPGLKLVTDRTRWPDLEMYVKDIVTIFGHDRRVLIWDLYNEPGNSKLAEKSLPLAERAFAWARGAQPSQPLTIGPWRGIPKSMQQRLLELSDIASFHFYENASEAAPFIEMAEAQGRPVVCTEWLRRQVGNTFDRMLPIFAAHNIGWYQWGLVAGKTQTYMPWGSKEGDPMPKIWQHDVFHPDGRPYDAAEFNLVKSWRLAGSLARTAAAR